MSHPESAVPTDSATNPSLDRLKGRWKWAAAILAIAIVAQSILWIRWLEDPTFFKMSVLFVWPAALFALLIWWTFFSGWSWRVRLGTIGAIGALLVGFFATYRLEWDGAMVPRRLVLRSQKSAEDIAREYLKKQASSAAKTTEPSENAEAAGKLVVSEGDWPGFRGPLHDGIVQGGLLRRNWEKVPPKELWRHPIGRAWSSFAVVGNHAFTQEQRDQEECVVAYDLETGHELWAHRDKALLSIVDANGGPGPHATPQFDEGFLYTLGGTGLLNCLDAATGSSVWSTNILNDAAGGTTPAKNIEWGMSGSPLIVDNFVIVVPGGSEKEADPTYNKGVAAYDKTSGKLVWAAGKHQASYATPRVEEIGGVRQLLITHANGLSGHSLETGEELWFFPLESPPKVNSAMPWKLDGSSLLFGTGYGVGTARLDITNASNQAAWTVNQQWFSNRFRPKFNDFVVLDGHIYGLDDGILACVDVANGKLKWRSGRYGYGQLILVDDVMLIISEDGELLLVPAVPTKPEPIASFKVFDSGFCWNHPTLVRGKLLVRNAVEVACFDVKAE